MCNAEFSSQEFISPELSFWHTFTVFVLRRFSITLWQTFLAPDLECFYLTDHNCWYVSKAGTLTMQESTNTPSVAICWTRVSGLLPRDSQFSQACQSLSGPSHCCHQPIYPNYLPRHWLYNNPCQHLTFSLRLFSRLVVQGPASVRFPTWNLILRNLYGKATADARMDHRHRCLQHLYIKKATAA